jgi:hypothetical protein
MSEHDHKWDPGFVFGEPGRFCSCGRFEQIDKAHFKQSFGVSSWRWRKTYDDQFLFGGYMHNKKRRD